MKERIKKIPVLLAVLMMTVLAGCGAEKAAERILGEWQFVSEKEYITKYIFWENGDLTESVTLFDKEGNELNISMSNTVDMHYEVVDAHTLKVYGTALGYDGQTEAEEIHLEFVDDDTMKLNDDTYVRVKQ